MLLVYPAHVMGVPIAHVAGMVSTTSACCKCEAAVFPLGPTLSAATSQVFPTTAASVWFPYISSHGNNLLALGSASQAVLYGWRGVFSPVWSIPADGVTGFTAFSPAAGNDILVVANGGTPGNREVNSEVYRITEEEELVLVSISHP